ncbi:MAG: UvrD-helicase domain-containing protein [Candidatus Eisenbacteria bacterium]|uniref:DNA 3'-5' helicase n=1 Tax=Eiseniibacteriota bacterium TaxID=2212470 RepID=A0A933SAC0_UNCEI|nr:UvrD-helicase domain-containing protein [Candidatus Eisenbacteria bacterium]
MATAYSLNEAQQQAVDHAQGAALVIAGAGSGKTRVLTARIEALLDRGVPPESILAFTFTNRAAKEMRERIEKAVGPDAKRLWVGTFHATAVRLLRRECATLGLPAGFSIYDREDQESLLRGILKELGLSDAGFKVGVVLGRISDCKNALVTPDECERAAMTPFDRSVAQCYRKYQAGLRGAGALDFDDLIAESVRLFLEHPAAGERWSRRFSQILVDEYQDTNHAQFRLVQALAAAHGNLFVVGDDDQSIYGWRGADLANVLDFERAFPGAVTIRLEQNYRSTRNILDAANAVVANNQARKGKTLWSEREAGAMIRFALCADEADEARRVRRFLEAKVSLGRRLRDCAVLYRTNAQSRSLETELRSAGIAYEIVGGVSFFQRREVKDMLAYLRLLVNPQDTASFYRIWNTPRRGLGPAVQAQIEARMAAGVPTPLDALRQLSNEGALKGAAKAGAQSLLALYDDLRAHPDEPLDQMFMRLLEKTAYLAHLEANSEDDLADRRSNVEELGASAAAFAAAGRGGLLEYLSECSLLTDADRLSETTDRVLLLTAHNAKGLEFDVVTVTGLEEGLMPHASSLDDPSELEEERRLFYVALTRARDEVMLTAAAYRRRIDGAWGSQVSRFVDEIPPHLLEREEAQYHSWSMPQRPASGRAAGGPAGARGAGESPQRRTWSSSARATRSRETEDLGGRTYQQDEFSQISFDEEVPGVGPSHGVNAAGRGETARRAVGRRVHHAKFGHGTVLEAEGEGPDMKLTVRFTGSIKKVLARFVTGGSDED